MVFCNKDFLHAALRERWEHMRWLCLSLLTWTVCCLTPTKVSAHESEVGKYSQPAWNNVKVHSFLGTVTFELFLLSITAQVRSVPPHRPPPELTLSLLPFTKTSCTTEASCPTKVHLLPCLSLTTSSFLLFLPVSSLQCTCFSPWLLPELPQGGGTGFFL